MNTIIMFLGFWASFYNTGNTITAEEVATRYCNCGHENKLPALAKTYVESIDLTAKESAKSEYIQAMRKTQDCIKMDEVQLAVRQLPRPERSQFEKKLMKILTETCSDVASSLQVLK